MKAAGEYFEQLVEIHRAGTGIPGKYARARAFLERLTRDATDGECLQFPDLFSRLSHVCRENELGKTATFRVQRFRIHANKIARGEMSPSPVDYALDMKALCLFTSALLSAPAPDALREVYAGVPEPRGDGAVRREIIPRARVIVESWEGDRVRAFDEERPTREPLEIACNVEGVNAEFRPTVERLWKGCRLNLLDVAVEEGALVPGLIILEPDFLLDISSLAECVKEYGTHPLHYLRDAFRARESSAPLLLGNAVNLFFDEICRERGEQVTLARCREKVFRSAPLDFATCEGIDELFFLEMETQFYNLRRVVEVDLQERGIRRERGLIEPSFVCEQLGVQGRLDFLQVDKPSAVIELKSGKAPFPERDYSKVGGNHRVQALLYQIVIQKVLGIPFSDLSTYILYSRYPRPGSNLRHIRPVMAEIRRILDVRNRVVAAEREIAADSSGGKSREYLGRVIPGELITDWSNRDFLERYIVPSIEAFQRPLVAATPLESAYFHSFHAFIAREHFLSRVGDPGSDGQGAAPAWKVSTDEKRERGDILVDLEIARDDSFREEAPAIVLRLPPRDDDACPPSFREGDIVMLYERNSPADDIATRQVFRASIESLTPAEIVIRPRALQSNPSPFRPGSRYAIERDAFNSSAAACRGLYAFLQASKKRRDLLLNQRPPAVDPSRVTGRRYKNAEIDALVLKAKQAADCFILVGPPGTGKTSIALKSMVEEFHADGLDILLLSYTNRAVDEICEALEQIEGKPPYARLGPELSCAERYRHRMLERIIAPCTNRRQLRDAIRATRVFVSTTAAMSGKTALFQLKHFHVAIIDEASQILEPQIIGILSEKDSEGRDAIDKFILVGDHKQLPAIVTQSPAESAVTDPRLNAAGIINRRDSLFERLYRLHKRDPAIVATLDKQGRMHPDISRFPARAFYDNLLQAIPVSHQTEGPPADFPLRDDDPLQQLVASNRLLFIPTPPDNAARTTKQNRREAVVIADILAAYSALCQKNCLKIVTAANAPGEISIGVITPYRNQIALVRGEISRRGLALDVTIDTVERFQGSQRDVIIYSCCVNEPHQLEFLSNTFEEDGVIIDRKLNVAITRARKQLFITGNPDLLARDPIYERLIAHVRARGGFIDIHSHSTAPRTPDCPA
ncbi:MAG: AAA family ATPase [Odoribacteraceae bacterium]|jgi:hypothetical protein|nr:AAA family ATPase [Odoribacteraceae bacterium]